MGGRMAEIEDGHVGRLRPETRGADTSRSVIRTIPTEEEDDPGFDLRGDRDIYDHLVIKQLKQSRDGEK